MILKKKRGFYATAAFTPFRALEVKLAEEQGLELREMKQVEAAGVAHLGAEKYWEVVDGKDKP